MIYNDYRKRDFFRFVAICIELKYNVWTYRKGVHKWELVLHSESKYRRKLAGSRNRDYYRVVSFLRNITPRQRLERDILAPLSVPLGRTFRTNNRKYLTTLNSHKRLKYFF